jgi:anti-sigma regulatory factor (Ser/Thr protein kinase)/anti-anti-sigma regulatory factor
VVVAFTGNIDLFSVSQVQRALLKDLSNQPFALICDLAGVDTLDPVCATVFSTVANHPTSRWPDTSFLLCGAQPPVAEVLNRLQVPHFLSLYADVDEAIDKAMSRPPYLRDELRLAPTPTAAAAARAFVREVCRYWQIALPDATVTDRAVLLASELVTNAVVHSQGPVRLRLELHQERLHLAVYDQSPRLLALATEPGDLEAEGGRGLLIIDQLASAWGVHPSPGGGKAIWCVLERSPAEPMR